MGRPRVLVGVGRIMGVGRRGRRAESDIGHAFCDRRIESPLSYAPRTGILATKMPSRRSAAATATASSVLQRYGLLLVPNFSLIALGAVVDPLRLANGVLGRKVYEFATLGLDREPIASSDGIRVLPDRAIADAGDFDAVFVIGPNPIRGAASARSRSRCRSKG